MAHLNRREPTQDGHGNTVGAVEIAFHLKPKVLVRVETKETVASSDSLVPSYRLFHLIKDALEAGSGALVVVVALIVTAVIRLFS